MRDYFFGLSAFLLSFAFLFSFTFLGFSCLTLAGFLALTAAPAGFTKALFRFVATCNATSAFGVVTIFWPATVTVPPLRCRTWCHLVVVVHAS